jgi:hypothetical protein
MHCPVHTSSVPASLHVFIKSSNWLFHSRWFVLSPLFASAYGPAIRGGVWVSASWYGSGMSRQESSTSWSWWRRQTHSSA